MFIIPRVLEMKERKIVKYLTVKKKTDVFFFFFLNKILATLVVKYYRMDVNGDARVYDIISTHLNNAGKKFNSN